MKKSLILLCFLFLGASFPIEIDHSLIEDDLDYLVDLYKDLHASPELSLQEKNTSMKLAGELRKVGFEVTENVGGYGIVGIMKNGEGPQILYRTDMDGLPMWEKTDLAYASKVEVPYQSGTVGTMHSCGHDMHMATWIGVARAMAQMKDKWSGTLMMIGQPAEEIGKGAKMMLDAGLYEKFGVPDYGLALHCNPVVEAGSIAIAEGFILAAAESIDIKVKGIGAHGASPHMSIDPIVVASMIVMELQTIVSRNIKPIDDAVVTVGAIKGGTKHNIIPDEVTLQLTVRTYKEEVRQLIHRRIREISRGVAIAAGLPEDKMPEVIIPDQFTPPNYNDPALTARIRNAAEMAIGKELVVDQEPRMGGEDFARYGATEDKVPCVMFSLGTVSEERMKNGDIFGLHSPFYYPEPTKSLETGVTVMSQSLLDLMPKK